jgi:uncharacterized protein HemY
MKRILLILFLVIVAGAGMLLAEGRGSLVLTYGDWTIQIQLWLVIFGLLVLILLLSIIIGTYRALKAIGHHSSLYFKLRSERRANEKEQAKQRALQNLHKSVDLTEVKNHWQQLSHRLRNDAEFARAYVKNVLRFGGDHSAADVIEQQLNRKWDAELIQHYGLIPQNAQSRLKQIDYWLSQRPHDTFLLLAAGRLAMNAEMWGKAEQYLQQSIAQKPTVSAYLELAEVQQQLGKTEMAWRSYQAARQQLRDVNQA